MTLTELRLGDITIDVIFKDIKNVHLSVHPPTGRVRVAAPLRMSLEAVRLFAVSKVGWIRKHQGKVREQDRETPREFLERESHYVWGDRYLLRILPGDQRPSVSLARSCIELTVPSEASYERRRELLDDWYRQELRQRARPVVAKWEKRLEVSVSRVFIQRMKTKWGSSNPARRSVRLNLDLAKFAPRCLDYVVLHEMAHFIVPNHSEHFAALLDRNMPGWRTVRDRLNEGPLSAFE